MSKYFDIRVCPHNQKEPIFIYEDRRIPYIGEVLLFEHAIPVQIREERKKQRSFVVVGVQTDVGLKIVDRYDEQSRSADSLINRAESRTVFVEEITE